LKQQEVTLTKKVYIEYFKVGLLSLDEVLEQNLTKKPNSLIEANSNKTNSEIKNNEDININKNDFLTEEELLKKVLEDSKKENKNAFTPNKQEDSIQFILEQGFTYEEAIMAYSYSSDPVVMMEYLYSLNMYR